MRVHHFSLVTRVVSICRQVFTCKNQSRRRTRYLLRRITRNRRIDSPVHGQSSKNIRSRLATHSRDLGKRESERSWIPADVPARYLSYERLLLRAFLAYCCNRHNSPFVLRAFLFLSFLACAYTAETLLLAEAERYNYTTNRKILPVFA